MTKLSNKSEAYLDKILKYYPMEKETEEKKKEKECCGEEKGKGKEKYPQQHLHDYRKERQIYDRPTEEKLDSMRAFKQEGNNHYANQRYKEASYFYQKVIIWGDYTFPDNEQDCNVMDELVQQGNTNLALCLIKLDDWEAARVNLIEGSKGSNLKVKSKALYWLTKYYIRVAELSKAQEAIDALSSMDAPFNACREQLSTLLKQATTINVSNQKKVCSNMFSK